MLDQVLADGIVVYVGYFRSQFRLCVDRQRTDLLLPHGAPGATAGVGGHAGEDVRSVSALKCRNTFGVLTSGEQHLTEIYRL